MDSETFIRLMCSDINTVYSPVRGTIWSKADLLAMLYMAAVKIDADSFHDAKGCIAGIIDMLHDISG